MIYKVICKSAPDITLMMKDKGVYMTRKRTAKTIIKKCAVCQLSFETIDDYRGRNKQTCSKKCSAILGQYNSMVKMVCSLCGDEALVTKAHSNDEKVYCLNCKKDKKRYFNKCKVCRKDFYTSHKEASTCSKICTAKMMKDKLINVRCTECNTLISRPSRDVYAGKNTFCNNRCSNRYHSRIRPKKYGKNWGSWILKISARDHYTCQICYRSKSEFPELKLEIHHKIPLISFDTPEEAHYDENLITYCHDCHMETEKEIRRNKSHMSV